MTNTTESICRTCLIRGEETRSLHAPLRVSGVDVTMSEVLATFYNCEIDLDDGLPQEVCISCTYHLSTTYSFNTIVQNSQQKLNETKVENSDCFDEDPGSDGEFNSDLDIKPDIPNSNTSSSGENTSIKCSKKFEILFCVECQQQFNSSCALFDHCTQNHPSKRSEGRDCKYCNEKFENLHSLIIHNKLHKSPHVCRTCWMQFEDDECLNSHPCGIKETETQPIRKMSQCDQCGKSYPIGYIKLHMKIHGTETFYACKYCPKKFKVRCGLNSHMVWNHIRTRNHKCDVCDATFITASARSAHKRKNHLNEKNHMCESCGKGFFSKSQMQRHMLTHSGEKNFHCHLCDKSYQTRYGLNIHLKSHSLS